MTLNSNTTRWVLIVSLLFLAGNSVTAQKRKKADPCANPQTQGEMNECAAKAFMAADATLNQVYRKLATLLEDDEKPQLKEAQNAWLKYRDSNCMFVAGQYKGGTMEPMIYSGCLADMTKKRTTELSSQIKERKL